jgi:hypothetical protein
LGSIESYRKHSFLRERERERERERQREREREREREERGEREICYRV